MYVGEISESLFRCVYMSFAPKEQFKPMDKGLNGNTVVTKASNVCPLSSLPLFSTVAETMSGKFLPVLEAAVSAAFKLSVSNTVSNNKTSAPPSASAFICSKYACCNASKSQSSDITSVLFDGPTEPATKILRSRHPSAALRAKRQKRIFVS